MWGSVLMQRSAAVVRQPSVATGKEPRASASGASRGRWVSSLHMVAAAGGQCVLRCRAADAGRAEVS